MRQARDDVRLRIVTNGNFGRYTTLTRQLGIDDAIELLPDSYALLPERLSAATIALNPRPLATGLPQKLLNYMAAGRPILFVVCRFGRKIGSRQARLARER